MTHRLLLLVTLVLLTSEPALAGASPVTFVKKPSAAKTAGGARVEFTVSAATDVAVYIEDANGKIIRHLAAGVLGRNAPAPLTADSLEQSVTWNGKADYGKDARPGPFRVRVALGLGVKFDRVMANDPKSLGNSIGGLAIAADGTLYALVGAGAQIPNWGSSQIVAVNRDGRYVRTVAPFPANIAKEKLGKLQTIDLDGRLSPMVHTIFARNFYPGPSGSGLAVTPDGVLLRMAGGYWPVYGAFMAAMGTDSGIPWGEYLSPDLSLNPHQILAKTFICPANDGKSAYVTGIADSPAVYRIKLPERDKLVPFFGDVKAAGKDETHLAGVPHGMALDGKGNLLIADFTGNRVVMVSEKDGKFVDSFPFEMPDYVAVDPNTGAIYVTRAHPKGEVDLVMLRSPKDDKPVATMTLRPEGDSRNHWIMALDAAAKPPIVWLGGNNGTLHRVQEVGGKFEQNTVTAREMGYAAFEDISIDRYRDDKEIYVRLAQDSWLRLNETTDKTERIGFRLHGKGQCVLPGPDGNVYGLEWPANLYKWDRAGKPVPWDDPQKPASQPQGYKQPPNATFMPVCMGFMMHTFGLRWDNHPFVFARAETAGERASKDLWEFAPSGKRIAGPLVTGASDVLIGPRFDQEGNIYVAEVIKPLDQLYPPEFEKIVGPIKLNVKYPQYENTPKGSTLNMYGSIVKFGPKGGKFYFDPVQPPATSRPDLGPDAQDMMYYFGMNYQWGRPAKLAGATWVKMGISHVDMFYCNCENVRFDVDEFGRVWYPDLGRFRVCVLDTNGNDITHVGAYGNADSAGPGSAIPDPEIPLAWLVGVGATDRYVYMGDSVNRRLLRAKLAYVAEASCEVK